MFGLNLGEIGKPFFKKQCVLQHFSELLKSQQHIYNICIIRAAESAEMIYIAYNLKEKRLCVMMPSLKKSHFA